jgi:hypothetical protein
LSYFSIRGYNVTEITLTLDGTTAYPKVYQSLCTMLSKKALNPADVTSVKIFLFIFLNKILCFFLWLNSFIKFINQMMHHLLILFENQLLLVIKYSISFCFSIKIFMSRIINNSIIWSRINIKSWTSTKIYRTSCLCM